MERLHTPIMPRKELRNDYRGFFDALPKNPAPSAIQLTESSGADEVLKYNNLVTAEELIRRTPNEIWSSSDRRVRRRQILRDAELIRFSPKKEEQLRMLRGKVDKKTLLALDINQTPGRETYFIPTMNGSLAAEVVEPKDGTDPSMTIISFHGLPGSRLESSEYDELIREANARLITFDRPGLGLSPPLPDRQPVHSANDGQSLVRYFNSKKVALIAGSGGCLHALACARLPEVTRVAIMAPLAPLHALGEAWFDGMDESNQNVFRAAFADLPGQTQHAQTKLANIWRTFHVDPSRHFTHTLRNAPEYADPDQSSLVNTQSLEEGLRYYRIGYEDEVFGIGNWGFDPRKRQYKEVLVIYGGKDVFAPPQHGQWLAENIPGATGYFIKDATHKGVREQGRQMALDWCLGHIDTIPQ